MWIDNQILLRCHEPLAIEVFLPETPIVVLGASNDPEKEVHQDFCKGQRIPIARRAGGGGAVILYPGSLILSLGTWVKDHFNNGFYFDRINAAFINLLSSLAPQCAGLSQNGISDIVWREQKVAGTSIFRSRNYLLYQASLLLQVDSQLIDGALPHPSKEPTYRAGKEHRKFLTGLIDAGLIRQSAESLVNEIKINANAHFNKELNDLTIAPEEDQWANLYMRAEKNNMILDFG